MQKILCGNKMDIEAESAEFLQLMMDTEFNQIMSELLILDVDWIEWESEGEIRGVATMGEMCEEYGLTESNIVCLFPPFKIKESK